VRTIVLDPISEFLYWRMNWHTEHHMYAGTPCYNLPALYQAISNDTPAPRTLLGAWQEMRETWRRQQQDPDYQFDTPLPPTAHPAASHAGESIASNSLVTSIGDLAPKAIA
jgi:fatty acid desaturase